MRIWELITGADVARGTPQRKRAKPVKRSQRPAKPRRQPKRKK